MTEEQVLSARISEASKAGLKKIMKTNSNIIEAKRTVIRVNFVRSTQKGQINAVEGKKIGKGEARKAFQAQKRMRSDGSTSAKPAAKKAWTEGNITTFKETLTAMRIAVVHEGYPRI